MNQHILTYFFGFSSEYIKEACGEPINLPPSYWVAMKRYDPFSYVEKLNIPTLIIDAEEEELFAREKNGLVLHAAIKDRLETKYVTYPGKHYDMYRGAQYQNALRDAKYRLSRWAELP